MNSIYIHRERYIIDYDRLCKSKIRTRPCRPGAMIPACSHPPSRCATPVADQATTMAAGHI